MIGISWAGRNPGGIEIWEDGIVVSTPCCASSPLTDHRQILQIYHLLGDWLMAHPEPRTVSTPE